VPITEKNGYVFIAKLIYYKKNSKRLQPFISTASRTVQHYRLRRQIRISNVTWRHINNSSCNERLLWYHMWCCTADNSHVDESSSISANWQPYV